MSIKYASVIFCVLFVFLGGCEETRQSIPPAPVAPDGPTAATVVKTLIETRYAFVPVRIKIIKLTDFTDTDPATITPGLKVYVELLDEFGSQLKAPGSFRFELYNYLPRSAESKGKRIFIWSDIKLIDSAANNTYWHDFLRSYVFELPIDFDINPGQTVVLQAECLTASGSRLVDSIELIYSE